MMPKSAKGGGRNRSQKKIERYSVPITVQLAAKLKAAAKGRADDAPLLLQSDGRPWDNNPGQNYHREVDKVVTAIGLDPADVTMYALRHSSIVRMLLQNIPIRLVASLHNTSVAMIEKTLFDVHHRAQRRHLAQGAAAARAAERRERRGAGAAMKRTTGYQTNGAAQAENCGGIWSFMRSEGKK